MRGGVGGDGRVREGGGESCARKGVFSGAMCLYCRWLSINFGLALSGSVMKCYGRI